MNARHPVSNAAFEHYATTPISLDEQIAKLKGTLLNNIKRSAYVYRVDCGGCNGCEIEIFATITPVFDAERFGIKVVPSPRHADILVFTGAVTRAMRIPALRAFHGAPDPKICVSYGACGCGGGIFHDLYCVWGGSDKIVPIDVFIPGCPPTPAATIFGFAVALGLLDQKLKAKEHDQTQGGKVALIHPGAPLDVRILVEREARRMAGYYKGRLISDQLIALLEEHPLQAFSHEVNLWLEKEGDPRLNEIVQDLMKICEKTLERKLSNDYRSGTIKFE